jgi:Holliday junction resolvase RusA-like endonuclease
VKAIKSRPQRLTRKSDPEGLMWRTTKPDADNVLKIVLDAIETAGIVTGDQQVALVECRSLYAEKVGHPRVEVTIETLEAL